MKIYYITNVRIPTEKAHGIQITKMCEAFADLGHDVELIVPRRKTHITEDLFAYYRVKSNFKVTKLWCLDTVKFGQVGYQIELLTFSISALWCSLFRKGIFYTRDEFIAVLHKMVGKRVVWEAHMGQRNIFVKLLVWLAVPLVVISHGLKDLYIKLGIQKDNISVAPDGVDVGQFDVQLGKEEVREKLGLEKDGKIAIYTGSQYAWKGVEVLKQAEELLPDVEVMIVSGKPYSEIPLYLAAADVLILPNSSREDISKLYTSPMKLFEYMASGRPIVASDLPSIREVLNENNSVLVRPDDPSELAHGINKVLSDKEFRDKISRNSYDESKRYTWHERARSIISFIE